MSWGWIHPYNPLREYVTALIERHDDFLFYLTSRLEFLCRPWRSRQAAAPALSLSGYPRRFPWRRNTRETCARPRSPGWTWSGTWASASRWPHRPSRNPGSRCRSGNTDRSTGRICRRTCRRCSPGPKSPWRSERCRRVSAAPSIRPRTTWCWRTSARQSLGRIDLERKTTPVISRLR